MNSSRQSCPIEKTIGDYTFNIFPFPAMTSTRLSGDVAALVVPLLSGAAPIVGAFLSDDDSKVGDMELSTLAPSLAGAFASLSGEKVEKLIKQMLIDNRNISFWSADNPTVRWLDTNEFNEIFCGDIFNVYVLAFEVIKVNFGSFFPKISNLFGNPSTDREVVTAANTAN